MSDERIGKLEVAVTDMANKFSEFLAIESARKERDKHQLEENKKATKHIDDFNNNHKPVILRMKKWQTWVDFFLGKIILPAVIMSILAAAGYNFI